MWLWYLIRRLGGICPVKVEDGGSRMPSPQSRIGRKGCGSKRQEKLVVIHAQPCIFWLCTCTRGRVRLLQILTVAVRNTAISLSLSQYIALKAVISSSTSSAFALSSGPAKMLLQNLPRNSFELGMTDVKVVARPNYCRGRLPRLQGCQSELVGAGSKLSSQQFGLPLHIRSLVLCRLWVSAEENMHTHIHPQTHIYTQFSGYIQTYSGCTRCACLHTFALAGLVTDCGTEEDFQQAGNKNWHKSRIKYSRICASWKDGVKAFQNGSAEMRQIWGNFFNWFRGLRNWRRGVLYGGMAAEMVFQKFT